MVMIGKVADRDSRSGRQFKPKIYQGKGRGQNRGSYDRCIYDQKGYRDRYKLDSEDRSQYRQDRSRPRYEQNYRRGNFRDNVRMHQNFERQNSRGEYRNNYRHEGYNRNRDRNRSRERSFSRNFSGNRSNKSTSNSKFQSGSRESMNRDRIGCYRCREYDHFTKGCPTSREERELELLQQMLNLDDEQT